MDKQSLIYLLLFGFFVAGVVLHILSAKAQAACNHKWVWNRNLEKQWCERCWKHK